MLLSLLLACSPPERVFVVGMDGLDREELDLLLGEGTLPNFARVLSEGCTAPLAIPVNPIWSPIIWTTYASGYAPEVHGIGHWAQKDGSLLSSDHVRVDRVWDVATRAGIEVLVVGWPITMPAPQVKGALTSDRHYFRLTQEEMDTRELTWPRALVRRYSEWRPDEAWVKSQRVADQAEVLGGDTHPILLDEFNLRAFTSLLAENEPVLATVYLAGADQLGHLVFPSKVRKVDTSSPRGAGLATAGAPWIDDYYRYLDDVLGRLLPSLDPLRDTLLVMSDHGFRVRGWSKRPDRHREPAVLIGWGKRARRGASVATATMYDVGPTLYALLGLPLAKDYTGRPLDALFTFPSRPDPVASRVHTTTAPIRKPVADPETTERLKSLGYLDEQGKPVE